MTGLLPFRCRRGMVLPLALVLVLALAAVALSMVVLAHTELILERGAIGYLEDRMREEATLDAAGSQVSSGGFPATERPLRGGFVLIEAEGKAARSMAVRWRADPDSVAQILPGAVEIGEGGTAIGGMAAVETSPECSSPPGWPLVRVRTDVGGPPPDPPLSAPPHVGPVGLERLLEIPGRELHADQSLAGPISGPFLADDGARVDSGEASGVLLSRGDLDLGGTASFRGLVMVAGDLRMEGDARVEGVVLAGGAVSIEAGGGAGISGCPGIAAEALAAIVPEGLMSVPAGGRLGRF